MSVYFSNFPNTTHNGNVAKDITRRTKFKESSLSNPYAFLPYVIQQDEKPEDIAFYYYGSVRYTWLVYFSVDIIDPYFHWPLTSKQFDKYIIKKYETQADAKGDAVLQWSLNETITDNIVHYINSDGDKISPDSFDLDPSATVSKWTPVRVFEYENQINEDRRAIELIDLAYAGRAEEELRTLLNDGIV